MDKKATIVLHTCWSACGGDGSIAQMIADTSGKNTVGWSGECSFKLDYETLGGKKVGKIGRLPVGVPGSVQETKKEETD